MHSSKFLYLIVFLMLNLNGHYCLRHIHEYIDDKLRESEMDFKNNADTKPSNTPSSMKEVILFDKAYKRGYIINLLNETYITLGSEWIKISNNGTKTILKENQNITFAEGFEFEKFGFILSCIDRNICNFYKLSKEIDVNYIQTIIFKNELRYFQHCVINSQLYFTMDDSIYVWTGTHFDQISQLPNDGLILVTFPSNMGSQIIISAKFQSNRTMIYIYESINNEFILLQKFNNPNKIHSAISYIFENVSHVMFVTEDVGTTIVYRWIDSELSFFANLNYFNNAKVSYKYVNQTIPVFLVSKLNIISLYQLSKKASCLFDIAVVNTSKILDFSIGNDFKINVLSNSGAGRTIFSSIQFNKDIILEDNVKTETNELFECVNKLEGELNKLKLSKKDSSLITRSLQTRSLENNVEIGENLNTKIFNGKVIVKNDLHAEHMKINKPLFFNTLNGLEWKPEKWLSISKPQIINGSVVANSLNVRTLDCQNTSLFTDLLFTPADLSIGNTVTITKDIIASTIEISKINDMKLQDIYLKNSANLVLGTKYFKNVNTNDSTIGSINMLETATILTLFGDQKSTQFNFSKNLQIESLEVGTINGIDFDNLYSDLYKVGIDSKIEGNLEIETATIHELVTKRISGINSNLFLDKVTNQHVNSSMEFRNIDAIKIISNIINGDDLENMVYIANNDTGVIKGSVHINDINILGDLHLSGFMSDMADSERILGTNATDLLQIYNKSVTIQGNVTINNVILQRNSTLSIDSLPFSYDALENYWLYDKNQFINRHVTFKSGMAVPSINLEFLNDVPFSYYVNKDENVISNMSLKLETLVLNGNMISNFSIGCEKLLNESVKITGKYFLTGKKIFAGNVGVNKLKARQINDIDLENLPNQISFTKKTNTFSTIVFKESVFSDLLFTKSINSKDLAEIWNSALRTNLDLKSEKIIFENVTVMKLDVGDLNGVHFNEYISSLDQIYQLKSLQNVLVSNAIGRNFHEVQSINSIPFLDVVNHENYSLPLTGEYHFNSNLFIKDLKVAIVNGINFGTLTQELFYRHWSQDITGYHTFNVIQAAHLGTPQINSYNLESLIDVNTDEPQELLAPGGIFLSTAKFFKSLFSSNMKYDINKLTNILRNEPTRFWSSVKVIGDVEMLDENCVVQQLVNQAIHRRNNTDTYITGQVTFENVQMKNVVVETINGINLNDIIKDAVVKNEPDQIIMGKKQFIKLSAHAAASLENVQIPVVNKILLSVVNASIIDKNSINSILIRGKKTFFDGLQTNQLITKNISDAPVETFVSLDQPLKPIASIKFDKLQITGDLIIGKINNIDFNVFLDDRLLLDGPPQTVSSIAYFNLLNINGPSVDLPQINNIFMADVVFDEQTVIESTKIFKNAIHCSKPYAEFANGHNITEMYQRSIFYDDPMINVSSIRFSSNIALSNEAITATTLNDANMDFIRDMVDVSVIIKRSEIIGRNIDNIRDSLMKTIQTERKRQATQFAYLEKATELQVNLPNTIDGRVSESSDGILLHVDAEEVSNFCALPTNCTCRNQHTVHISKSYSVSLLENKGYQRVFTYYNDNIAVNIITSTVSTSHECRKENTTDELTTISWTIAKAKEINNQRSFIYPESIIGYLNDVSFFEFNDILYIVLSRQYDAHKDTSDVDAIIMRFSQDKDQVQIIQYIPSRKSNTAKVFQTSAGIILVIDSTPKMSVGTDIDGVVNVYNFNEQLQTFELLRSILDGACSNSQLVNVDEETHFIVLTCRDSVKVFKYYPEFRNYYLFQLISEPYLVSVTVIHPDAYLRISPILFISRRDSFAVFRFRFLSGFSLFYEKPIQGMTKFVPFTLNSKQFLFCPRLDASFLLKVVING